MEFDGHKICYIILTMIGKKETPKRNEDTTALIDREWGLVLNGKGAEKLVELLRGYEMDLLTNQIDGNKALLEKYVSGLLIAGDYLELGFLMRRVKEVSRLVCRSRTNPCWLLLPRRDAMKTWAIWD